MAKGAVHYCIGLRCVGYIQRLHAQQRRKDRIGIQMLTGKRRQPQRLNPRFTCCDIVMNSGQGWINLI